MNLVIPTYKPHYDYNINFLNSFSEFCLDKKEVNIKFIVNESDFNFFNKIDLLYPDLKIKVVTLRDLIFKVDGLNVQNDSTIFNSKYPLQSLKKLYSHSIVDDDYIVIDSENLCVKNFYFRDIIEDEKSKPIYYTNFFFQDIQKNVTNSCNSILNTDSNKWFFLKSYWFYEKKIVEQLILDLKKEHPFITNRLQNELFFEYQLYCEYIDKNNLKEMSNIDLLDENSVFFSEILRNKNNNFEYLCVELNDENLSRYLSLIYKMKDKIVRLHWMPSEIKERIIKESDIGIGTFHWD
jgi:hypothetical protein